MDNDESSPTPAPQTINSSTVNATPPPFASSSHTAYTRDQVAGEEEVSDSELDELDSDSEIDNSPLAARRGILIVPLHLYSEGEHVSSSTDQGPSGGQGSGSGQVGDQRAGDCATLRTHTKASGLKLREKANEQGVGATTGDGKRKGKGRGKEKEKEKAVKEQRVGRMYRQPAFRQLANFKASETWRLCHANLTSTQRAEALATASVRARQHHAAKLALINDPTRAWGLIEPDGACGVCKKAGSACVAVISRKHSDGMFRIAQRIKNGVCDLCVKAPAKSQADGRNSETNHISTGGGAIPSGSSRVAETDEHSPAGRVTDGPVYGRVDETVIDTPQHAESPKLDTTPSTPPRVPLDPAVAAEQLSRSLKDLRSVLDYACKTLQVAPNDFALPLSSTTLAEYERRDAGDGLEVAYMLHDAYEAIGSASDTKAADLAGGVTRSVRLKDEVQDAETVMDDLRDLLVAARPGEATEWFVYKGERALRLWKEAVGA